MHTRLFLRIILLISSAIMTGPMISHGELGSIRDQAASTATDEWNDHTRLGWIYELGQGWVWSQQMGLLYDRAFPWLYHYRAGWMLAIDPESESKWYYAPEHGWIYTPEASGTYLYGLTAERWVDFSFSGILRKGTKEAPMRVLSVGDSITYWTGSYRIPLQQHMTEDGFIFDFVGTQNDASPAPYDGDHEGYSGKRVNQVYWTMFGNPNAWGGPSSGNQIVQETQPDLILIMLGTNDLRQGHWPYEEAPGAIDVIGFYRSMLLDMAEAAPRARIVVCGLARNLAGDMDDGEPIAERIQPFNTALANLVTELAEDFVLVTYVDCYDALQPEHIRDGLHPTEEGFRIMADVFYEGILR